MIQTAITLAFADGSYTFKLGLAQIEELQRKCGCGIGALCARLMAGRFKIGDRPTGFIAEAAFHVADVVEPIRQGLIGGGEGLVDGVPIKVTAPIANELVAGYVTSRPLSEAWDLSVMIVAALMEGYTPPKKAAPPVEAAAPQRTPRKRKAGSTTPEPSSTAP